MNPNQEVKRRDIVQYNFTRGCNPRSGCGNEKNPTNPCKSGSGGTSTNAQEDGSKPVPPHEKACSWNASQASVKSEQDACRIDSMSDDHADYYMTDPQSSSAQCLGYSGFDQVKSQSQQAGLFCAPTKAFSFGNINSYVGCGSIFADNIYGYRRNEAGYEQLVANRRNCCLGAGTFQQGKVNAVGFRPGGASCTTDDDCLQTTWSGDTLEMECYSSTGQTKGGICRSKGANSGSRALFHWKPNPNNVWYKLGNPQPLVCDMVWTPGVPQKDSYDTRATSADTLWSDQCGTEYFGAKGWCADTINPNPFLSDTTYQRWDVWSDNSTSSNTPPKQNVGADNKPCKSTDVTHPGCPCDQSPNSTALCKVDMALAICSQKNGDYKGAIEWCASNCKSFQAIMKEFGGKEQMITMCSQKPFNKSRKDYELTTQGSKDDASYCRNWLLGKYADGSLPKGKTTTIMGSSTGQVCTGGADGILSTIVKACAQRFTTRDANPCLAGLDGTTPMATCPGWRLNNDFGKFCREVAVKYPIQADQTFHQYCEQHSLDEACDCLQAGTVADKVSTDNTCTAADKSTQAKNFALREAFCTQTKQETASTAYVSRNRNQWFSYCRSPTTYTLQPAVVWDAKQTNCTKDSSSPGASETCKFPASCVKQDGPDKICQTIIDLAGSTCVSSGSPCTVLKNITMSNYCGDLSKQQKECQTKGGTFMANKSIVAHAKDGTTVGCAGSAGNTCSKLSPFNGVNAVCGPDGNCIYQTFKCSLPKKEPPKKQVPGNVGFFTLPSQANTTPKKASGNAKLVGKQSGNSLNKATTNQNSLIVIDIMTYTPRFNRVRCY